MSQSQAAIEALLSRNSMAQLTEPGPSQDELEQMIQVALRACDHGWLRPTRFIVVTGDERAKLGQLFYQSTEDVESLPEDKQQKLLQAPLRAPMIIISVHHRHEHPRIPAQEQLLATAASTQNLVNAAWALGLGAIWRTGDVATNPKVAEGLGLANNEQVVGFVYVGTRNQAPKALPERHFADFVTELKL